MKRKEIATILKSLSSFDQERRIGALSEIERMIKTCKDRDEIDKLHNEIEHEIDRLGFLFILNQEIGDAFILTHPDISRLKADLTKRFSERIERMRESRRLLHSVSFESEREKKLLYIAQRFGTVSEKEVKRAISSGLFDEEAAKELVIRSILKEERALLKDLKLFVSLSYRLEDLHSKITGVEEFDKVIACLLKEGDISTKYRRSLWGIVREGLSKMKVRVAFNEILRVSESVARTKDIDIWLLRDAIGIVALLSPHTGLEMIRERLFFIESESKKNSVIFLKSSLISILSSLSREFDGAKEEIARKLLSEEPSPHVRATAVSLAETLGERGQDILKEFVRKDISYQVRARCLMGISRNPCTPLKEKVDLFIERFFHDENDVVRRIILEEIELMCQKSDFKAHRETYERLFGFLSSVIEKREIPLRLRRIALKIREWLYLSDQPCFEEARAIISRRIEEARIDIAQDRPYHRAKVLIGKDEISSLSETLDSHPQDKVDKPGDRTDTTPSSELLKRLFAIMAWDGVGFSLNEKPHGFIIYKGDNFRRSLWRTLHEILKPHPLKRRGYLHTIAPAPSGSVRFPPFRLGEFTMPATVTSRIFHREEGGWRSFIPTTEDFLHACRPFSKGGMTVYSDGGRWVITPPNNFINRVRGYLSLSIYFERYASLREKGSFDSDVEEARNYLKRVSALGFNISYFLNKYDRFQVSPPPWIRVLFPSFFSLPHLPGEIGKSVWSYFTAIESDPLFLLLVASLMISSALFIKTFIGRRRLAKRIEAIPLTIGGWGTRGKSGVERLKGAVFNSMGMNVVVKTTGSKPSLLVTSPTGKIEEFDIIRTTHTPSIWEQVQLLQQINIDDIDAFLYECMAVRPEYAKTLQDWMRDDFVTITNTFLDHEDQQGPLGLDVAVSMQNFFPEHGTLITTEEEMSPLLREFALSKGIPFVQVDWKESALLTEDVMKRFPIKEHASNVALVLRLMESLGIEKDFSLWAMTEDLVYDVGAAKIYPELPFKGRRVEFICGMSANDPVSFYETVRVCGIQGRRGGNDGVWLTILSNSRRDRIPRIKEFASLLSDFPFDSLIIAGDGANIFAQEFKSRFRERIKRIERGGKRAWQLLLDELHRWRMEWAPSTTSQKDQTTSPEWKGEELEEISRLERAMEKGETGWKKDVRKLLWRLFDEKVTICDEGLDEPYRIMESAIRKVPEGYLVRLFAIQNIKGVGLKLVQFFKEWESIKVIIDMLFSEDPMERRQALESIGARAPFERGMKEILLDYIDEKIKVQKRVWVESELALEMVKGHMEKAEGRDSIFRSIIDPDEKIRIKRLSDRIFELLSKGLISYRRASVILSDLKMRTK